MSEIPGQSGHALPNLQPPVCANFGSGEPYLMRASRLSRATSRHLCSSGKGDAINRDSDDPNRAVTAVDDLANREPVRQVARAGVADSQGRERRRHSRDPLLQRKLMFKKHTAENAYTPALCPLVEQPADMEHQNCCTDLRPPELLAA